MLAGLVKQPLWLAARLGDRRNFGPAVTYHLGELAIVQALGEPELAGDFWQAYTGLLGAFC